MNHCQKKCLGYDNNHGGCCTVSNRNFIIGPVGNSKEFIEKLKKRIPGVDISFDDVFIEYEEGRRMFPDKPVWQNPNNYPCLRLNQTKLASCIFYNEAIKCCSIYEDRPEMCRNYMCDYLMSVTVEQKAI